MENHTILWMTMIKRYKKIIEGNGILAEELLKIEIEIILVEWEEK